MNLTINGRPQTFDAPLTVAALLAALGIDPRHVVVERNRTILRREQFDATRLADGDTLELVRFVGGG